LILSPSAMLKRALSRGEFAESMVYTILSDERYTLTVSYKADNQ
jgi:hypothetical protein